MLAFARGFSGSVNLMVSVKLCSDLCHGNEHLEISTEKIRHSAWLGNYPLPESGGVSDKHPTTPTTPSVLGVVWECCA